MGRSTLLRAGLLDSEARAAEGEGPKRLLVSYMDDRGISPSDRAGDA
jgi:hypothetical protein